MFVDANIFIYWLSSGKVLSIEDAISGFILYKISRGELAVTSTLVKDEVLIWLSRYKASALKTFLRSLRMLPTLKIVEPTLDDQEFATKMFGKYRLGISDLINLGIMKRLNIEGIYTNDKGFLETGVKVVFYELKQQTEFEKFIKMLEDRGYVLEHE